MDTTPAVGASGAVPESPEPPGAGPSGEPADVLIVGFGPVGQLLALKLARRGRRVIVLEQRPEPFPLPRAVTFDGHAARILASAGLAAAIGELGETSPDYVVANAHGQTLLRVNLRERGDYGWPDSVAAHQPSLEAQLSARCAESPALRVLRGRRVTWLTDEGGHVRVVTSGEGGEPEEFRARWVVGCDGANSIVRARLGPLDDAGFSAEWMACDVVPDRPDEFEPCNLQLADPRRPRVAVLAGRGHRRYEFMRMPADPAEEFDTAEYAWRLLGLFGVTRQNAALDRHAVYTFRSRVAQRWRRGRMLVAGDAAHQMPPFAGQGLCSGMRDIANLWWKLDLVLDGRADADLLDTYELERRPHARRIVELSVRLGALICVTDPAQAAGRDAALLEARAAAPSQPSGALPDSLTAGLLHVEPDGPGAAAGSVSPQARVRHGGRVALLDEIVGHGFVLLCNQHPAMLLSAAARNYLDGIGAQVVHVLPHATADTAPPGTAVDVDRVYVPWLASIGAAAALIRPDFYIFGAAADQGGLDRVVQSLRERIRTDAALAATHAG